jgi:hypothetical protein
MKDARFRRNLAIALAALTAVGGGVALAGYLLGDTAPAAMDASAGQVRYYTRNDGGAVLFEHARHAADSGECVTCHHDLAGAVVDCLDCHEDPDYTADSEDHADLVNYHERDCAGCHEIAPSEDIESCRNCHEGGEVARVFHQSCNACHLETAPEVFADSEGKAACRACHLR